MFRSLELPQRIVLKPNLHDGRQDTTNLEARASVDHLRESTVRPVAVTLTLESKDCHIRLSNNKMTRKEAVKKLIHQFETHPKREALKADLEKDQACNPISARSRRT